MPGSEVTLRDDVDEAIAPLTRTQALALAWVDGYLLAAAEREPVVAFRLQALREAFPWLEQLNDAR